MYAQGEKVPMCIDQMEPLPPPMEPVLVHQSLQELLPVYGKSPNASAQDIIKALEVSSSHYYAKNVRIGYGIPNMKFAGYLSSNPGMRFLCIQTHFPII